MVSSNDCYEKYGSALSEKGMVLWDVPSKLEIGVIPKKIYCNRDMVEPLTKVFEELILTGLVEELRTWDGCFNIRKKRGTTSTSLHSWGIAVDVNAAWNPFGGKSNLSHDFVNVWKKHGFDWGGDWSRPDPMHFQLSKI